MQRFCAPAECRIPDLFEELPSLKRKLLGITGEDYDLLDKAGLVRITEVIVPGRKRPLRLVYIPSVIAYLNHLEELERIKREEGWKAGYAHHHKPEALLAVVPSGEEK
jgi:hypothetical protein